MRFLPLSGRDDQAGLVGGDHRHPAVAMGLVRGLLYVFPIVSTVVGNPHWQRHLEQMAR